MGAAYSLSLGCLPLPLPSPADGGLKAPCHGSEPRASLLDTVPRDVLHNMLRYLSDSPRADNWQSRVALGDAVALLCAAGPLRDAVLLNFTAAATTRGAAPTGALVADSRTRTATRRLRRLLERTAFVQQAHIAVQRRPRAWAAALERQAPALRSLCLTHVTARFPLARLLRATTLDELDYNAYYLCPAHAAAIGAHCAQLRKLRLECDAAWGDVERLWRGLPALTTLALCASFSYDADDWCAWCEAFEHIRRHCPALRHLALDSFADEAHGAIIDLCVHYGAQLATLRLTECFVAPSFYSELTAACPLVLVDAHVNAEMLSASLDALGGRLVALHIAGDEHASFAFNDPELAAAARRCTALQSLTVKPNDMYSEQLVAMLGGIFAAPKRALHTVEIYERYSELYAALAAGMSSRTFADIVRVLAAGTGALRQLLFSCDTPVVGAFDELARCNPQLEDVTIHIAPFLDDDEEALNKSQVDTALASIVTSFSRCPALRSLRVDEQLESLPKDRHAAIVDACASLRNRRVVVRILEFDYLL